MRYRYIEILVLVAIIAYTYPAVGADPGHSPNIESGDLGVQTFSELDVAVIQELTAGGVSSLEGLCREFRKGTYSLSLLLGCCKKVGGDTVPFLIEQAGSLNESMRLLSARGLGLYTDRYPESIPALCRLAKDESGDVAAAAILSLKQFGPNPIKCGSALRNALCDKRRQVRLAAMKAIPLVARSSEVCIESVLQIARSEKYDLTERKKAILVLGRVKASGEAFDYVVDCLDSKDEVVQLAAMDALSNYWGLPSRVCEKLLQILKDGPSKPGLIVALMSCPDSYKDAEVSVAKELSSEVTHVRREASAFLVKVVKLEADVLEEGTITTLLASLHDSDPVVRKNAVLALGKCGTGQRIQEALTALIGREKNERVKKVAEKVVTSTR